MVLLNNWSEVQELAFKIRYQVFVEEQFVPEDMELDEFDEVSWHAIAYRDLHPVATSRMYLLDLNGLPTYRISRMAVLPDYRGHGYGKMMMQMLLDQVDQERVLQSYLHSQLSVVDFYAKFGFEAIGDIFDETGILHQAMLRRHAQ